MAFVLQQSWEAGTEPNPPRRSGRPTLFARLLGGGRDLYFRKGSGTLLTALVHVLLIWVFVTKLTGTLPEKPPEGAPAVRMLRFDLAESQPEGRSRAAVVRIAAAERASTVDATLPTQLPPPEWTVGRVAAAQPAAAATAQAEPQPGTGSGGGAGSGGSGVYDPFAGAAPLSRNGQNPGAASGGATGLDHAMLDAARLRVQAALPGLKGTVEIVVSLSEAGDVLEATARGGSAPAAAKEALRRALIGARLFGGGSGPRRVALPRISFG